MSSLDCRTVGSAVLSAIFMKGNLFHGSVFEILAACTLGDGASKHAADMTGRRVGGLWRLVPWQERVEFRRCASFGGVGRKGSRLRARTGYEHWPIWEDGFIVRSSREVRCAEPTTTKSR